MAVKGNQGKGNDRKGQSLSKQRLEKESERLPMTRISNEMAIWTYRGNK